MATTINVLSPIKVKAPRAARWAAMGFVRLLGWFEQGTEARAVRHRAITRATEAAAVRAYAYEIEARDPRFAADLLAAADRHQTESKR